MFRFQAVRSGLEISQSIAELLEQVDPVQYMGKYTQTVLEVNNIIQGRSDMSLDMLFSILDQKCSGEAGQVEKIKRDVAAFNCQKMCRTSRYTLSGNQEYRYETFNLNPARPLKIISQPMFDHAAENGFPPDFFTESYFDNVTIYCMPDNVDCSFSQFQDCRFSVCGIRGAVFDNATLSNTDFHSALLHMVNFTRAYLSNTHFWDSSLVSVSFQEAHLRSCLILDCDMDRVDFLVSVLNGGRYERNRVRNIRNLPSATITQSGTGEEVERFRISVFRELGVPIFSVKQRPKVNRREKPHTPER